MSADGHISDAQRSPIRLGSAVDRDHLEQRLAAADAVLVGATTVRALGHGLLVADPRLRESRRRRGRPEQPIQIVVSRSCMFDRSIPFFSEPAVRWLVTVRETEGSPEGARGFDDVLVAGQTNGVVDWVSALSLLKERGVEQLCVLGGGQVVAGIVVADLADALWLTVCPVLVGGANAPTPVDGPDLALGALPPLTLVSARQVGQEVFLHYSMR
jgi:5-amino-6-(5-phosphoribosylamino)uracil reductase